MFKELGLAHPLGRECEINHIFDSLFGVALLLQKSILSEGVAI